ncbi:ribose-5-phosphate isomerase RpiA [Novosphingobium sp.]|uniref:ribose-5-phosphate isomerase RpiA n=1 Tax=Novosphingobium sp. TaxID=1874826 RepID=UPI003D0CBC61
MFEDEKRAAALAAAGEILGGMVIGLGTGSTVAELIPVLAARVRDGLEVVAVATSVATEAAARAAGIRIASFEDLSRIDLTIDGVDEIEPSLRAIKGAGGALLREKIVATASVRMVAIADSSKFSAALGSRRVAVEVLPFAREFVMQALGAIGAVPELRMAGEQPARSDQGNLLVDCAFAQLHDPAGLARRLSDIPGVMGHGLFLGEIDALYLARKGRVERIERP